MKIGHRSALNWFIQKQQKAIILLYSELRRPSFLSPFLSSHSILMWNFAPMMGILIFLYSKSRKLIRGVFYISNFISYDIVIVFVIIVIIIAFYKRIFLLFCIVCYSIYLEETLLSLSLSLSACYSSVITTKTIFLSWVLLSWWSWNV